MNKVYYTIGEVSSILELPINTIRFWESEFSQLRPSKGKHRIRKYTLGQIELIRKIKDLLYVQRFTIEGTRQQLRVEKFVPSKYHGGQEPQSAPEPALPAKRASLDKSPAIPASDLGRIRQQLEQIIALCKQARNE